MQNVSWIDMPLFSDARGALVAIEGCRDVPFPIRRVYFIAQVPPGARRAQHAHRRVEQVLIAAVGAFRVVVDDGRRTAEHRLSTPTRGLYLGPRIWHDLDSFSEDALGLVLASEPYDETDYLRDYDAFLAEFGEPVR